VQLAFPKELVEPDIVMVIPRDKVLVLVWMSLLLTSSLLAKTGAS
jgi:hypothetical protein